MRLFSSRNNALRGFTIVELLIVIVVIAILATISIVAYTGIQDRSRYAKALSDLGAINKAVKVYYAQHGNYPVTSGWRYYCSYQSDPMQFIPGLEEVTNAMPQAPCSMGTTTDDTWLYRSDGVGYKLIYLRANVSNDFRNMIPAEMRDTRWGSGTSWGYWTDDFRAI